jgi:hypothetical protein
MRWRFLGAVTPLMHDFWTKENPDKRTGEMINFMKNMAFAGSTLALMGVDEPWEASVPVPQPKLVSPNLAGAVHKIGRKLAV